MITLRYIFAIIAFLITIVAYVTLRDQCSNYRTEKHWKAPTYIQIGEDEIAIPSNEGVWIDVKVCEN